MSTNIRYAQASTPNQDNTDRVNTNEHQSLAYAASIALKLSAASTISVIALLTGALTLTAEVTRPQIGDKLTILFVSDATGRTVTFSTGFIISAATLVLGVSKSGSASFMFNGTAWVETGRCTQA